MGALALDLTFWLGLPWTSPAHANQLCRLHLCVTLVQLRLLLLWTVVQKICLHISPLLFIGTCGCGSLLLRLGGTCLWPLNGTLWGSEPWELMGRYRRRGAGSSSPWETQTGPKPFSSPTMAFYLGRGLGGSLELDQSTRHWVKTLGQVRFAECPTWEKGTGQRKWT